MKLTASVKRIIWAMGWYLMWILDDYFIYLREGHPGGNIYQTLMFLILIIPLFIFKDDRK